MITVYASIGNSDNKLSQEDWAKYQQEFEGHVRDHIERIHGTWYSHPLDSFQNMCMCFDIDDDSHAVDSLRMDLERLRRDYKQDSVAWAEVTETEFI